MAAGLGHDYGLYHIQESLNEYNTSFVELGLLQPVLDSRQGGNQGGGIVGVGERRWNMTWYRSRCYLTLCEKS